MQIVVYGKNLEITPALRSYAEKKVSKVERFFEENLEISAEVTMSVQKELDIVETTVQVDGVLLRGESRTEDMYASIDESVDKIERQIKKYKTRLHKRLQDGVKLSKIVSEDKAVANGMEMPKIVRTKRFAIKPMSVEEAAMQMDLLGHDFFVFANALSGEVNVVYRRRDGNYGLIEPEFE
ncbi:MAG: ribosome-associated translation inhibitor RaiA [Limnochordia bacterium]|jgi:putative sigma-54 modulation protein|nr:ribosome-associated translation inhibitor RaiA [Limnochordia bacterium]MDD4517703.1 ribosome-associated translation inhibitor RaiA [Limnochordia bacterium]